MVKLLFVLTLFTGFIANFISRPVISGFTSAVALTIVATQLGPHLGLTKLHKEGFVPTIQGIIEHIHDCREWDMILSAICITILLFMKVRVLMLWLFGDVGSKGVKAIFFL